MPHAPTSHHGNGGSEGHPQRGVSCSFLRNGDCAINRQPHYHRLVVFPGLIRDGDTTNDASDASDVVEERNGGFVGCGGRHGLGGQRGGGFGFGWTISGYGEIGNVGFFPLVHDLPQGQRKAAFAIVAFTNYPANYFFSSFIKGNRYLVCHGFFLKVIYCQLTG
jgi:hypothetical protein